MLKTTRSMFLKNTLNFYGMKTYINKNRCIIYSQWCPNLMKTHRTPLRVEMNEKDDPCIKLNRFSSVQIILSPRVLNFVHK